MRGISGTHQTLEDIWGRWEGAIPLETEKAGEQSNKGRELSSCCSQDWRGSFVSCFGVLQVHSMCFLFEEMWSNFRVWSSGGKLG